jgi:hypothetical protein
MAILPVPPGGKYPKIWIDYSGKKVGVAVGRVSEYMD